MKMRHHKVNKNVSNSKMRLNSLSHGTCRYISLQMIGSVNRGGVEYIKF